MSSIIRIFLITAVLSVNSNFAQSLSIIRSADNTYWLQASAPAAEPYTLQVSENLHLWIDVTNDVSAHYSSALTNGNFLTRFYRLKPTPPEPDSIRVLLLGDSIVSDCCGWGSGMPKYFKANAAVINYAQAFMSTKLFLRSAEFDQMLAIKPNYVLIEYGYWDSGADPNSRMTGPEFLDNLRNIVRTVRDFNGVPILVTLPATRSWDEAGNLMPSDALFSPLTRQVAGELNAPLIDLYKLTFDLFAKLGRGGCAFMGFYQPDDGLHVSPLGAIYVSQLIARAMPNQVGPYLINVLDPLPKP